MLRGRRLRERLALKRAGFRITERPFAVASRTFEVCGVAFYDEVAAMAPRTWRALRALQRLRARAGHVDARRPRRLRGKRLLGSN